MSRFFILISLLLGWTTYAQSNDLEQTIDQLKSKPYAIPNQNTENNNALFKKYCIGTADSAKTPAPNYNNKLVKSSALILQKTKDDADLKLEEMFQQNWVQNIETIKESLETLKKSTNPLVVKLATQLEASLNADNVGFTDQQKKWYDTMVESVFVDVKTALNTLDSVVAEFKGVDYKNLTNLVSQINIKLPTELKTTDFPKLKSLALSMKPYIEAQSKPVDVDAVIAAFKVVKAEFEVLGKQVQELQWTAESLDYYIKQLEADSTNLEGIEYGISEAAYYTKKEFLDTYPDLKLSEETLAQIKVLNALYGTLTVNTNLSTVDELVVAIDTFLAGNGDIYNVRWPSQTLESNMKILAESLNDSAFSAKIKELSQEVLSFDTTQILANLRSIEDQLKDADPANDIDAASSAQYLQYDFERFKSILSADSVALYGKIYAESAKVNQENIKRTLQEVKDLVATTKPADFISQGGWQVSDISTSLEAQKAALSVDSQATVEAYIVAAKSFSDVQNLSYYMSGEFEFKPSWHFYFYGQVSKIYNVNSGQAPYGRVAHTFLVQLCGEFRDRASMIEAKLNWIQNLFTLPKEQTVTTIDFKKNIWAQMSSADYYPFLEVTEQLWQARKEAKGPFITVGQYTNVDTPIEGPTVCETKYIFEKYVKKGKGFDDLETYINDYETNYRSLCSKADQEDYYDFRGDSNFKHYSPESNAMIWKATSMGRACKNPWEAKNTVKNGEEFVSNAYSDKDCQNYFERPFYYRYNAARSALATGLFYDPAYNQSFDSLGNLPVTVHPHMYPELAPMAFETETSGGISFEFDKEWVNLKQWNQSDIGFNEYTGLGTNSLDENLAYERIRGSVDRHTNWYAAGYNDGNGVVKEQAFSPFVASSYVMRASDSFTTCGITVDCPPDGLKRWMFIFRVKPQNWYNPQRILNNEPLDFDRMWFDETSFGDSGLANGESAWDRLGTAMEEELDSILYLINVDGGGFEGEFEGEFGDEGFVDPADFE